MKMPILIKIIAVSTGFSLSLTLPAQAQVRVIKSAPKPPPEVQRYLNGSRLSGTDLNWKLGSAAAKIDKADATLGYEQPFWWIWPTWYIDGGFTVVVGGDKILGKWPLEYEGRGTF